MPDKEEALEVEGVVTQALANTRFRVRLDSGGAEVMAHVAGRMRKHFIRIVPGDRVKVENLRVLKVVKDKNLLVVKGCVPGHKNSYVIIEK